LFLSIHAVAQNTAIISGNILDEKNVPIELVNISVPGTHYVTTTNKDGKYQLTVPASKEITIVLSYIGYETVKIITTLQPGEKKEFDKKLNKSANELPDVEITQKSREAANMMHVDPKNVNVIPSISGGVEALIKTMPGVASNNELSSQYSVRGGNYDENLVYVNDIEIYRPFLVRSGQQEGLSFINSDLVSSIQFSSGGFDAKYGDKMSSVLDITYKKPKTFAGSVSGSLLGGAAHLEYGSDSSRFSCLIGVRQKSNQYILSSLDTKGDYKPSFTDIQTYMNYDLSKKWSLSFLGDFARNKYNLVPQTRNTKFGTINDALQLTVYFDGQEVDSYETFQGAVSATCKPNDKLSLKFIASAFQTYEDEAYDIQGQYWLDQLETQLGSSQFGNKVTNLGVGTFLDHARNDLEASVASFEHKGYLNMHKSLLQWGVKYNREIISYNLNEWRLLDSADYSIPHPPDNIGYTNPSQRPNNPLELQDVTIAQNTLSSNRFAGFLQNNWEIGRNTTLIAGVRSSYWDVNHQLICSPRASLVFKPKWKKDFRFRFSSGYYQQPPFFRELIDLNGNLNTDVKAQTSVHFVTGSDYYFKAWNRPFKFTSEIYYKYLDNLNPYEIDDIRIRYLANNNATGYATGIDMRVNGEFVKDAESWASLSIMKTMEKIKGDYFYDYFNAENQLIIPGYTLDNKAVDSVKHNTGWIPRPTDERVNFSLFFQDYIPNYPTYKVHMTLVFGTGLPFGPPNNKLYQATLRMPPYRRVDIGFSKLLKSEKSKISSKNPFYYFKTIWVSVEIFNLLQIENTVSYIWIQDVNSRYYAVPNYLTPRELNVKLIMNF